MLLLLAGCGGSQTVREKIPPGQIELARQLFDAGDYTAAAEEYLKLAQHLDGSDPMIREDGTPVLLKQDFRLTATEAYIKTNDSLKARKSIALVSRSILDGPLLIRYDMAFAEISALDQQPEQVIQALSQISEMNVSPEMKTKILQMQITAFESLESLSETARTRTQLDPFLETDMEQAANRRSIWKIINQLEPEVLLQIQNNVRDPLASWAELSILTRANLFNAEAFQEKIDEWRLRYPDHAAETPVLLELFKKSELLGKRVSNIALLLPQTGRFSQAGAAVRDGFLSAWYDENDQLDQPMVRVYAADTENILDAYQQAVEEGAEFIVGPLEKNALKTLLTLPRLPVRTLALNQLSEEDLSQLASHIDSDYFYQFGLSPEQEARQIAEKAWATGYDYSLAITPEGAWGDRIYDAFKTKYEELGGEILEHQQYENSTSDYSTPVSQLLNIDGSQQRHAALTKQLNRKIKFETRPRKDADFVFMAGFPVQARQIRPQLLYHRASGVPVMSTSHAFGLPPRGEPDLDMDGVIIGDMPWLIDHQEIDPEKPLSMQQNWPDDNAAFLRLFALGIDAYNVISHLGRLKFQTDAELQGETGTLTISEKGQIQRELAWSKFIKGKPQLIHTKPSRPSSEFSKSETQRSSNQ